MSVNIVAIVPAITVENVREVVYGLTTAAAKAIVRTYYGEPLYVRDHYGFEYAIVAVG